MCRFLWYRDTRNVGYPNEYAKITVRAGIVRAYWRPPSTQQGSGGCATMYNTPESSPSGVMQLKMDIAALVIIIKNVATIVRKLAIIPEIRSWQACSLCAAAF